MLLPAFLYTRIPPFLRWPLQTTAPLLAALQKAWTRRCMRGTLPASAPRNSPPTHAGGCLFRRRVGRRAEAIFGVKLRRFQEFSRI